MSIDPAHVEAVAQEVRGLMIDGGYGVGVPVNMAEAREAAEAILTSTDPDVHEALLATLVRAGMLRAQYDPGVKGIRDFPDRRRYVTRWEETCD